MLDLYVSQDQFNRILKSTEVSKCGPGACIVTSYLNIQTLQHLQHCHL